MSQNIIFMSIVGALAVSWFLAPQLLNSRDHLMRMVTVAVFYATVGGVVTYFLDARSAFATLELGLFFMVLSKLFLLNLEMMHAADYPKNRRCY